MRTHLIPILMAAEINDPYPTLIISDTFTRADSTTTLGTTETGETWIPANTSTWGISSNTAYSPVTSGQGMTVVETGLADAAVQVTVTTALTGVIGVGFRYKDDNNWLKIYRVPTSGFVNLTKMVAGAITTTPSIGPPISLTVPYTMRLELTGSTVKVKFNGITYVVITVAEHTDGTKHGLSANFNTTRFDNFAVYGP